MAEDIRKIKLDKIEQMRNENINPYPERYEKQNNIKDILNMEIDSQIKTAGRLIAKRKGGKLSFSHIQDFTGKIQLCFEFNTLKKDKYDYFKKMLDIGDFLGVEGKLFKTRTGELSILVQDFVILSKTLRPLPEKWHGLEDRETRYRQRYLDLTMNEEVLNIFKLRTSIVKTIRKFLDDNNFEEVETPVLQTKPSGALAKPFKSHHNALDMDVYLRIAPETWLKRLIVGGYERVYEFARCFRNEGMDPSHLQDFTMLEFYVAYWNFRDNMKFTRDLIQYTLKEVMGTHIINIDGQEIDFSGEWEEASFRDLILKDCGIDINDINNEKELLSKIKEKNIEIEDAEKLGLGNLIDQLYKKISRPKIKNPTFLINHPISLSPLARRNDDNPLITDRFQLVINSWEIVNAYSELVDPIDQRHRFEEQTRLRKKGDDEAMPMDEDYLLCMEYGMPPMSGWGMGIDRFVSLLTNSDNLRDVVLFPLMRPDK
jgi:lysyl-tRNA synthetase class 2